MSHPNYHGLTTQGDTNSLLSFLSIGAQQGAGGFGRMFDLYPLYLNPISLENLGQPGGVMEADPNSPLLTNSVPLGMIFFGQFIDHDITLDATSSFSRINDPNLIENFRTPNLDLDCIFGDGPEVSPYLYESNSLKLITGTTNQNQGQTPPLAAEDLPRTGQGVAIIGDPRNDENRVISQLQLAFIRFYNAIYDDVAIELAAEHPTDLEIYEEARRLTTWHYQWVVLHEFLPLLCGKETVDKILGMGRQFYRPVAGPFIPVEFSVAAYRFGHSMIAQRFKVQSGPGAPEFDLFSPLIGAGFSPLTDASQVVDWSVFFDFGGDFQKAEKLDIKLAKDLLDLPFVSGGAIDKSLATRNLRRGQSFLLPSGENVARKIGRTESEIQDVRQFLEVAVAGENIDLGPGIPLWLYILAEAQVVGKDANAGLTGEGLGPVGGTIVAEVLIGLMELDPGAFLGSNRNWTPSLGGSPESFKITDLLQKASLSTGVIPISVEGSWGQVTINSSADFYTASFPGGGSIGYTAGENGVVLKTADGGNSWYLRNTGIPSKAFLYDSYFLDANRGFIVGNFGNAYQTTDGGQSWSAMRLPGSSKANLRSVFFPTDTIGFIVADGAVFQSQNRGRSWKDITASNILPAGIAASDLISSEVYFISEKVGFILLQGRILRTSDGGTTWSIIDIPGAKALYAMDFPTSKTGYLCGIGSGMYKSTDGGNTWEKQAASPSDTLTTVKFSDKSAGFTGGTDGALYFTNDGGDTWTSEDNPSTEDFHELIYLNTKNRYLGFGKDGTIILKG